MRVVHDTAAFREACDETRAQGRRLGLVPTMGALHAGHLSLVTVAAKCADDVAVSIFVNPTQFGPGEDLEAYPRTLDSDVAKCREAGVSLVFAPHKDAMYRADDETRVNVGRMAKGLCGDYRPHHFEGVTTIVTKLLNIAGPCTAVFGRKDYQQWRVIERIVRDLFLPVDVVGAPIVREPDGLALSSRNAYLDEEQRQRALALSRAISRAVVAHDGGERRSEIIAAMVRKELEGQVDRIDYITLADPDTVAPVSGDLGDRTLLAVAAHVGATRLIDNAVLGADRPPHGETRS